MLEGKESTRPLSSLNYFCWQRNPLALQLVQSQPNVCFLLPRPGSSDLSWLFFSLQPNAKNEKLGSPPYPTAC